MVAEPTSSGPVLVVNRGAGSVASDDLDRLSAAFPGCRVLNVAGDEDFEQLLSSAEIADDAPVVAVGGDGTVSTVARALAGSAHPLGIIPRGTFNNFARALDIPLDFEGALETIRRGSPRPVTLGKVNGRPFLEVAAIGLFGEAMALGEASKDLHYGEALERLGNVVGSRRFHYRLSGDSRRRGTAESLVIANTPSTGAGLEIGGHTPEEPYLELTVNVGKSRFDLVKRLVRGALRRPRASHVRRQRVRRVRVETSPPMRVYADIGEAGETPAEIEAIHGGLKVIR
jgi:diacylglycerol kinase family enzyme